MREMLCNEMIEGLDFVQCISAQGENPRHERCVERLQSVGLSCSFFRPKASRHGHVHGCFRSHIRVMQQFVATPGAQIGLIIEDDVRTPSLSPEIELNQC